MSRGQGEREPFDPRRVSPSRVEALSQCGVAFKMKYVDGLPEERSGSAALRGSVYHAALEKWTPNRGADLLTLVRSAWLSETEGTAVKDFLGEYAQLSVAAIKQEHAIRQAWAARGKESRAPRMTKEWKDSAIAKSIGRLLVQWIPKLEDSHWKFTDRDPLPGIYDESLVWARRYQARWGHLPPSLYTEFAFDVEWRGFILRGYIDCVEPLISPEGEQQGIGVTDYKTYADLPEGEMKDWRQLVTYDVAIRSLLDRGALALPPAWKDAPLYVGVDYCRALDRRYWEVNGEDYDRLERELKAFTDTVERGNFLPAEKGRKPDFCPYPSSCCLRNTTAAGGSCKRVEISL